MQMTEGRLPFFQNMIILMESMDIMKMYMQISQKILQIISRIIFLNFQEKIRL